MNSYVLFNGLIGNAFKNVWNSLWLLLDEIVYFLVGKCYEIFSIVARVSLFGDGTSDAIATLTKRIYVILGVIMLFVFAYNIILIIISPDKLDQNDDKSMGGLAKNLIISIVLISLLPVTFDYVNQLQNKLLDSHVIENVFLGGGSNVDTSKMGDYTALNIVGAFYHPIDKNGNAVSYYDCVKNTSISTMCNDYVGAWNYALSDSGNVGRDFIRDDKLNDHIEKGDFEYIKIVSTVCGVIALLMFVSYTLDIGVRVAKLAILQIIAPVPVILRISKPSGGTFSNWLNELIKTYLSLFVRLLTIYFTLTTIALISEGNVFENISNIGSNSGASGFVIMLAKVVVILGILKFAKDAPEMLEKMFGVEHLPFSPKDIGKKITSTPILGKPINKAYGAATGALGAASYAAQNRKVPFGQAVLSGAANGLKKGGSQYGAQRAKTYQTINNKDRGNPNIFGKEPWFESKTKSFEKSLGNALDNKYDNIIENGATEFVKQGIAGKLDQKGNAFVKDRYQAAVATKARDSYVSQYVKRNYDNHESKIAGYEEVFKQRKDYQDTLDKVKSLNANLSEKELRNTAMSEYMKTSDFNNSFADAAGIKESFDESVIQTSKGRDAFIQAANDNWNTNAKDITDSYVKNGVDTESIITEIASAMTEDEKKEMVPEYEDAVKHGSKKAEKKQNEEFVKNLTEAIKKNADSLKDSGVTSSGSDTSKDAKK